MLNVRLDEEKFDELQTDLIKALLKSTKANLNKIEELKNQDLEEISEQIVFDICNILDNSQPINDSQDGVHLCFCHKIDGGSLITVESGGWSHEYVFGASSLNDDS